MKRITKNKSNLFLYVAIFVSFGLIIPSYGICADSDSITTLFLVRHAEKAQNDLYDPTLTPEGENRADELKYILKHVKLDAIYSTPYRRTKQTVLPTAEDKNLEIQYYKPGEKGFLEKVLTTYPGGTVLIAGHSNTIPGLANELTGHNEFNDLADAIYDNLFIAYVDSNGQSKIIRMRFGTHTPEK